MEPLTVRPFGRLLVSYTVNELGDSIGAVALALLVFDRTGAVAPVAAFFIFTRFLPAMFAAAVTPRVDQYSLRGVLPAFYVFEAAAFVGLAAIAHGHFLLAGVLALGFLDGLLAVTARGLTRAAIAATLQPRDLLGAGNALVNLGFAVASVGGAALGGVLVSGLGLSTALLVDAASFLVIAAILVTSRRLPRTRVEHEPWWPRFRSGLAFARRPGPVRALLTGEGLALICFTLVVPIDVIYARQVLHTSGAGFGLLLASWGAGILIGSMLYLAVRDRSALLLIIASTTAVSLGYLGLAVASTLAVACAASVVGGIGNGIQWVAVMTALQEATPPDYQARVTGFLESLGAAMPGVGYLLGGAIVAAASPRAAYAIAGCGVLVLVFAAIARPPRLPAGRPLRYESSPPPV